MIMFMMTRNELWSGDCLVKELRPRYWCIDNSRSLSHTPKVQALWPTTIHFHSRFFYGFQNDNNNGFFCCHDFLQNTHDLSKWFKQHVSLTIPPSKHPNVSVNPTQLTNSSSTPCMGLFANRDFERGQIVLEEDALISLASDEDTDCSRGTACSWMIATIQIMVKQKEIQEKEIWWFFSFSLFLFSWYHSLKCNARVGISKMQSQCCWSFCLNCMFCF